jgi:hypothetical protein
MLTFKNQLDSTPPPRSTKLIRCAGHVPTPAQPVFYPSTNANVRNDYENEIENDYNNEYDDHNGDNGAPTPPRAIIHNANTHRPSATGSVLGVRKAAPTTPPSPSNVRVIKTRKTKPSGSRNHLMAHDLPTMFQAVLSDAQGHFCMDVCTNLKTAFPDPVTSQEMAATAWSKACKDKGVVIEFKEDFLRLVRGIILLVGYIYIYFLDYCSRISNPR